MTSGCTLIVSWDPQRPCPLVIGCNRDDYYDAPLVIPHVWKENADVIAERDMRLQGGCWFGVTRTLRWGALTCVRDAHDGSALRELAKGRRPNTAKSLGECTNSMVSRSMMIETREDTEKERARILAKVWNVTSLTRIASELSRAASFQFSRRDAKKKPWDTVKSHYWKAAAKARALKAYDDAVRDTYQPPTVQEDGESKELKPRFTAKTTKSMSTADVAPAAFGDLLSSFLKDPGNINALVYMQIVAQLGKFQPFSDQVFSLLIGDASGVYFYTNGNEQDSVNCLPPGMYTFSCAGTVNPAWPKFQLAIGRFLQVVNLPDAAAIEGDGIDTLLDLFGSTVTCENEEALPLTGVSPEYERFLSGLFIASPEIAGYGTRSTTVVVAGPKNLTVEHREYVREVHPPRLAMEKAPEESDSEEGDDDDDSEASSSEAGVLNNVACDHESDNDNDDAAEEPAPFLCNPSMPHRSCSITLMRKAAAPDLGMPTNIGGIVQPVDVRVAVGVPLMHLRRSAAKVLTPAETPLKCQTQKTQ